MKPRWNITGGCLRPDHDECGARESILNNGIKIALPLDVELESEQNALAALKARTGIDPLDVEGMLDYVAPRA